MPKHNTIMTTNHTIHPPGYALPIRLARPVTDRLARRLTENYARIDALNEARKTLDDAASAMGMNKSTFILWLEALNYKWTNKKTYNIR